MYSKAVIFLAFDESNGLHLTPQSFAVGDITSECLGSIRNDRPDTQSTPEAEGLGGNACRQTWWGRVYSGLPGATSVDDWAVTGGERDTVTFSIASLKSFYKTLHHEPPPPNQLFDFTNTLALPPEVISALSQGP